MPARPASPRLVPLALAALLLAGCGRSQPATVLPPAPPRPAAATPRPRPAVPAPTTVVGGSVRVVMTDRFRFEPAALVVQAGRTVTFSVRNAGRLEHEFLLGDRAAQRDHELAMRAMGGMEMGDAPDMVTVPPGQTRRLTWTFETPGVVIYGCHVTGHYTLGMHGTITVVARLPARPASG
jgi:uncharacterized cupredoxin-like copper-binding protein